MKEQYEPMMKADEYKESKEMTNMLKNVEYDDTYHDKEIINVSYEKVVSDKPKEKIWK